MGFQFDAMFIDSFMDDVTCVRDVEVCVERMICYIPGCSIVEWCRFVGARNRTIDFSALYVIH